MEDFHSVFETFGRMLECGKVYLDPGCSFRRICEALGVDPVQFGGYVFSESGFSGEEILAIYRRTGAGL